MQKGSIPNIIGTAKLVLCRIRNGRVYKNIFHTVVCIHVGCISTIVRNFTRPSMIDVVGLVLNCTIDSPRQHVIGIVTFSWLHKLRSGETILQANNVIQYDVDVTFPIDKKKNYLELAVVQHSSDYQMLSTITLLELDYSSTAIDVYKQKLADGTIRIG